jgi:hypothetical protein
MLRQKSTVVDQMSVGQTVFDEKTRNHSVGFGPIVCLSYHGTNLTFSRRRTRLGKSWAVLQRRQKLFLAVKRARLNPARHDGDG